MDVTHLTALRRELHSNPELGFKEHQTAERVARHLSELGLEVHRGVGKTGVVGVLRRGASGRSIGLRADMDALPMADQGEQPWRSNVDNVCHACGHDGHTVMLLGAAERLARDPGVNGTVCFIFQPAEEGLAGAQAMIDDGLFTRFPCDEVYALHNWPELPVGAASTRSGPIMAAADRFDITLSGPGGHAAQPHLTHDTLLATSELVVQLNTIVSRVVDPCEPGLLSVTRIQGGSSHNMIPSRAAITGTVRTFSATAQDAIERQLRLMANHISAAHGLEAAVDYHRYYPATVNAPEQAQAALAAARAAGLDAQEAPAPALTSEDFAFMLLARPGAYLWLGSGPGRPLHHSAYDFNDEVIPLGIRWFCEVARARLS
ncbi:amidohydrolase [Klebsiella pneumoniae]|uniref:amidohydrolase n=1 Tax=Klebsiella pneumoniae TaxID=573 RepID=UPI002033FFE1|nr:amidohydrolase [Klebsiella pneumoniae]MCM2203484.1 amidohydrolase [Klebsiella pneumoniae]